MRPARAWPLGVAAALLATAAGYAVLFRAATGPGAAVVEPDYYRRAVAWDSTARAERRAGELGWRLEADLGALTRAGSVLTARLADRSGAPLDGARLRVSAVHNLDAAHPVAAELAPAGAGAYATRLPLAHAGLWELRFEAARGAEHAVFALRREAAGERP